MAATAVVKFGSTSTTLLVARHVDHPDIREQRLFDMEDSRGADELVAFAEYLAHLCQSQGYHPLAAGGERLRHNGPLRERLRLLFPRWWHLSGEEEGRLAWMAVKARHPAADVVIDLGGASTEIVDRASARSLALGAAVGPAAIEWPNLSHYHHPVVIGGTAVALSRWAGRAVLGHEDIARLRQELEAKPESFQDWDPVRRLVLPRGLALLHELVERGGWPRFLVSSRGLTEGLWLAASLGRGRLR